MERSLAGGMDQFFITPFMALIVQKKLQATYARLYAISFFRLRRVTKLKRRSEKENLENISFDNNYYYFGSALMSANHATQIVVVYIESCVLLVSGVSQNHEEICHKKIVKKGYYTSSSTTNQSQQRYRENRVKNIDIQRLPKSTFRD